MRTCPTINGLLSWGRHFGSVVVMLLVPIFLRHATAEEKFELNSAVGALYSDDGVLAGEAALWIGRRSKVEKYALVALVEQLENERDAELPPPVPVSPPTVGDYAAVALERLASLEAVPLISQFLVDSQSQGARLRALRILRSMGKAAHRSTAILKRLCNDDDELLRFHAIETISAVSTDPKDLLPVLQHALSDRSPNVKAAAVQSAGNLGDKAKELVPGLVALLESNELRGESISADAATWAPLRGDAAVALGKIGLAGKEALPKLEAMLKSNEPRVRFAAAFAHASISDEKDPGLRMLLEALQDNREPVAELASYYLRELGRRRQFDNEVFEGLMTALKHQSSLVRIRAIEGIALMRPDAALNSLRSVANDDPDEYVRQTALARIREISSDVAP